MKLFSSDYVRRFQACSGWADREALIGDLVASDTTLRKLFSQQRDSWEVPELLDPSQYLIDVFYSFDSFACVRLFEEEERLPKVFPLLEARKPSGHKPVVGQSDFLRNFGLFSERVLESLDWNNVFAAGGSVLGCLQRIPGEHDQSNRSRRKYYHDVALPGSDVDLFLYGLDAEAGKRKILEIYDAVRETNPYDVLCFRSAHSVSIVSQYPFRHIQIVLRLYSSPCEVLAGFDVDACAVGFDGTKVWMAPRCHMALVRQMNTVDMSRRSPTYEMRLAKYAGRGFEVCVPGLERGRVDPMIFERPWTAVQGLAKLLLLERLRTPEARFKYKDQHRSRTALQLFSTSFARKFRLNRMRRVPRMAERLEDTAARGGAEASDYSTVFLPWGPGYDAAKCARLMRTKDALLNNRYLNKGRTYALHACFIGSAQEVLKDCAPNDPPLPPDVDPELLSGYVCGPLTFLEDDPGRQMVGSFHPTTEGDWTAGAMLDARTEELCAAACARDVEQVRGCLLRGAAVNSTDCQGRTALHMAALVGAEQVVDVLLKAGANACARMRDGRTVLHIAAAYGHGGVLDRLLEHRAAQLPNTHAKGSSGGAANESHQPAADMGQPEKAGRSAGQERARPGPLEHDQRDADLLEGLGDDSDVRRAVSSASECGADAASTAGGGSGGQPGEVPVLDLDAQDFAHRMTALHMALLYGQVELAKKLLAAGASASQGWLSNPGGELPVLQNPLTFLSFLPRRRALVDGSSQADSHAGNNEAQHGVSSAPTPAEYPAMDHAAAPQLSDAAVKLIQLLVAHGCRASTLGAQFRSLLHDAASRGDAAFLSALLEHAPDSRTCLNVVDANKRTPLLLAVHAGSIACVRVLLAAGAKVIADDADCDAAWRRFESAVAHPNGAMGVSTWMLRNLANTLAASKARALQNPLQVAVQAAVQERAALLAAGVPLDADSSTDASTARATPADSSAAHTSATAAPVPAPSCAASLPATTLRTRDQYDYSHLGGGVRDGEQDDDDLTSDVAADATGAAVAAARRLTSLERLTHVCQEREEVISMLVHAGADVSALVRERTTLRDWLQCAADYLQKDNPKLKQVFDACLHHVTTSLQKEGAVDSHPFFGIAAGSINPVSGARLSRLVEQFPCSYAARAWSATAWQEDMQYLQELLQAGALELTRAHTRAATLHVLDLLAKLGAQTHAQLHPTSATSGPAQQAADDTVSATSAVDMPATQPVGARLGFSGLGLGSTSVADGQTEKELCDMSADLFPCIGRNPRAVLQATSQLPDLPCTRTGGPPPVQYFLLPASQLEGTAASDNPDVCATYQVFGRSGHRALLLPERQFEAYARLFQAAWEGDITTVQQLCSDPEPDKQLRVATKDMYGHTPLLLAAAAGHAEVARQLLRIAAAQCVTPHSQGASEKEGDSGGGCAASGRDLGLSNWQLDGVLDEAGDARDDAVQEVVDDIRSSAAASRAYTSALAAAHAGVDADAGGHPASPASRTDALALLWNACDGQGAVALTPRCHWPPASAASAATAARAAAHAAEAHAESEAVEKLQQLAQAGQMLYWELQSSNVGAALHVAAQGAHVHAFDALLDEACAMGPDGRARAWLCGSDVRGVLCGLLACEGLNHGSVVHEVLQADNPELFASLVRHVGAPLLTATHVLHTCTKLVAVSSVQWPSFARPRRAPVPPPSAAAEAVRELRGCTLLRLAAGAPAPAIVRWLLAASDHDLDGSNNPDTDQSIDQGVHAARVVRDMVRRAWGSRAARAYLRGVAQHVAQACGEGGGEGHRGDDNTDKGVPRDFTEAQVARVLMWYALALPAVVALDGRDALSAAAAVDSAAGAEAVRELTAALVAAGALDQGCMTGPPAGMFRAQPPAVVHAAKGGAVDSLAALLALGGAHAHAARLLAAAALHAPQQRLGAVLEAIWTGACVPEAPSLLPGVLAALVQRGLATALDAMMRLASPQQLAPGGADVRGDVPLHTAVRSCTSQRITDALLELDRAANDGHVASVCVECVAGETPLDLTMAALATQQASKQLRQLYSALAVAARDELHTRRVAQFDKVSAESVRVANAANQPDDGRDPLMHELRDFWCRADWRSTRWYNTATGSWEDFKPGEQLRPLQ